MAGYPVIFATRHPGELGGFIGQAGHGARAAAVGPAARAADIVVLAVPYKTEPGIARHYGQAMQGKMLVDVDNAYAARDGTIADKAKAIGKARYSARLFAGTRFVRAFNTIPAARCPTSAKSRIRATGGTPVYQGGLANAPEYSF